MSAELKLQFVDTNVLVYAFDLSQGNNNSSGMVFSPFD